MPELLIIAAIVIYFLAGLVKGTLGLGFPTAAIAMYSLFVDARSAVAYVVIPMCVTNIWQVYRCGHVREVFERYWRLILAMMLAIAIMSVISAQLPIKLLTAILAFGITLFAVLGLWKSAPLLPEKYDKAAQLMAGWFSGIMGGLAGVWAPLLITYLYSRRVNPAEFVQAVGVFLLLGSLVLLFGLVHTGVINTSNAPFSAFLVLPALLGFSIGEQLRAGLDRKTFEKYVLVFFLIIGLNLFRRAMFAM
jgi:uncharacterized membrane protein YfcA